MGNQAVGPSIPHGMGGRCWQAGSTTESRKARRQVKSPGQAEGGDCLTEYRTHPPRIIESRESI